MLPVGFSHSSLTKTSAQPGGTTLCSRTRDVLPIASRRCMEVSLPTSSDARDYSRNIIYDKRVRGDRADPGEVAFAGDSAGPGESGGGADAARPRHPRTRKWVA